MKSLPYIFFLLFLLACANPGSGPDGGPYDETPPKIVAMSPELGQKGGSTRKISIFFDEGIKVENASEKIIVSPPQLESPEIKTSGKRITVELLDSLKPNTTYTIDFSDAIVDANESNPLGNFTYFFSTGEEIDSFEVSGYVLNASDLEPIKGILVGLHANLEDSAFTSEPFQRVARTDGNGHFCIKGVASGDYRIYALKDMDNDFKYVRGETLAFSRDTIRPFAFPDTRFDTLWVDTVTIDSIIPVPYVHYMPDNIVLTAFSETNNIRQILKTQREPNYFKVFFTAPSKHVPQVKGLNFDEKKAFVQERNKTNDTITYWLCDTLLFKQDTLRCEYTYISTNDSTLLDTLVTDTLEFVPIFSYERRQKWAAEDLAKWEKQREKRHKRGDYSQETPPVSPLKINYTVKSALAPDQNLYFSLEEPAAKIDTSAFHLFLMVDSTYQEAPFRIEPDSFSLLKYTIRAEWRPGQEYILNIDSASIVGLSGKVNNIYDAKFKVSSMESFGALFFILPGSDTSAVVQLLNGGGKPVRQCKTFDQRADFFYLSPGQYYVRLFYDRNGNGVWDTGSYADGRQAEEVFYYPEAFTIRANWDIEQTWRVNALPLQEQKPRELVKQKEETKDSAKSRNEERLRQKGKK